MALPMCVEGSEEGEEAGAEAAGGPPPERIPARYNRESELRLTVPADSYTIDLSGAAAD